MFFFLTNLHCTVIPSNSNMYPKAPYVRLNYEFTFCVEVSACIVFFAHKLDKAKTKRYLIITIIQSDASLLNN